LQSSNDGSVRLLHDEEEEEEAEALIGFLRWVGVSLTMFQRLLVMTRFTLIYGEETRTTTTPLRNNIQLLTTPVYPLVYM